MDFSEWKKRFNPPGLTGRDLRNTQKYGFAGMNIIRPVGDGYSYECLNYNSERPEDAVWTVEKCKTKKAYDGAFRMLLASGVHNALDAAVIGTGSTVWRVRYDYPVSGSGQPKWSIWWLPPKKSWSKLHDFGTDTAALRAKLDEAVLDPKIIEDWRDEDLSRGPLHEVVEVEMGPAEAGTLNKLPLNTCVKWPYRACGGGCEEKACCTCKSDDCNSRQTCASPGGQPHHDHQDGWPTPPDEPAAMMLMPAETTPAPASLDACTAEIRDLIQTGRHAAVRISVLIAQAHASYFKESPKDWLKWAGSEFGYKRRFCFSLLKAGKLLVRHDALNNENRLLVENTDIAKLEFVSDIPAHLLPVFLKRHPDLASMARDEVKTLSKCYAQGKTAKEIEAAEDAIAEAKLQKKSAKSAIRNPQSAIKSLVSLSASQPDMNKASQEIDPMPAFRAGFTAINLALLHLECGGAALSQAQFDSTMKLATDLVDELGKHQPQEA